MLLVAYRLIAPEMVSFFAIIKEQSQTVWHISWEYPPHITGGLGVACAALVVELSALLNVKVFHVSLLAEDFVSGSYEKRPWEVNKREGLELLLGKLLSGQYVGSDEYFMKVQRLCCHVLSQQPPAGLIIHAHDWHSILAAVAMKRRYGIAFVLHLHSTQVERQGAQSRDFIYALEQWGMDEAETVVCVSQNSANYITKHYKLKCSKVKVVHNASTSPTCGCEPSADVRTLLFAGRMCCQKSPELMIEIMRRLLVRHPHLKLLMVGAGEELRSIQAVVDFCQIGDSVEVLGMLPQECMGRLYQRADVLCLPSAAEPFGLVALEAAERGLAVLLSDQCGAKELLLSATVLPHRDVNAWVNALDEFIKKPQLYRAQATAGQKEAASRTWQDAADEILAIYARMKY